MTGCWRLPRLRSGTGGELVAILGVGVALLAVQVVSAQRTDRRIEGLETCIAGLESRMASLEQRLETRIVSLEQRMARLEGLLDGLREGLFERVGRQN